MIKKSTDSRNISSCGPLKVSERFGGMYCLIYNDGRINREKYEHERSWQAFEVVS
jgi:hypothetical protein